MARTRVSNLEANAERSFRGVNSTKTRRYRGPNQVPLPSVPALLKAYGHCTQLEQKVHVVSPWTYMPSRPAACRRRNSSCLDVVIREEIRSFFSKIYRDE